MGNLENSYRVDPDLVKKELLQILSSEKFRNAQVLSMFLQFVVEETLAGHINEIKEYTIGIRALGRSADFNPQIDAVVRIHAGRLRRMLSEYYEGEGTTDPVRIEIPRGSYVPTFKYNNHNEVVVERTTSQNGVDVHHRKATLAVFPFHNRSSDDSKNYFVEGMGEQLCSDLAKFQHLSVISYDSTHRFAAENKNITDLHKAFHVDYILTGSIRFSGGVMQVNIQLMLAETDTLLWTQTYLRHFNTSNLYNVQDEIIEQIVYKVADSDGVITRHLSQIPTPKRQQLYGVYDAIYLYYSFRGKYDGDSFQQSVAALERAASVEPENALIWSMLAKLYINNYMFKKEPSAQDLTRGIAYTEKAMWLDQNCQYANKVLAWIYLLSGKKDDCFEAIERCLDINSKAPSVTGSMGFLLICIGKYNLGFRLLLKTMHLNPVLPWYCNLGFAIYYYNNEKYEDAFNWTHRSGTPEMPLLLLLRMATLSKINQENNETSLREFQTPDKNLLKRANQVLQQFIFDDNLRKKLASGLAQTGIVLD